MKMTFKLMMVLLVAGVFATSCGSSETETAQVGEEQQVAEMAGGTFTVDTAASVINWKGEKFTGDKHLGTLNLAAGELSVENGNITAGNFTIDMTSIEVTDEMPADKKGYLVTHLTGEAAGKEGDFFNTKKYPTATFAITGVEAVTGVEGVTHKISGNLTMLEKTGNVTFDANVVIADGNLTATTTDFTFDRTVWGIKFMSTLAGMVKEQAIKNEITISVKLQASAAK